MTMNKDIDNKDTESKEADEKVTDHVAYEAQVREEIEAWKNPDIGVLGKALATLNTPVVAAGDALMDAPQFGDSLKNATEQAISTLSDAANWTLNTQEVIDSYQEESDLAGSSIEALSDIKRLPIAVVDKQVKLLKSKYVALTSAQGVTTGVVGWVGIPADVVGLITANLRAIGEYATHYGFDINDKGEQLFAMSLLAVATSSSAESRQAALDDTHEMIKDPEKQAFNQMNEEIMSRVLRQTATKVATNMVKTKAAQVIPAVGAVVAGGVNANYTANVCEAAHQCYRERFLDRLA